MKRVVIIGAGPAGLTAGVELLEKSSEYEVIILEESNQAGGISRTVRHNGKRMDIGGHRFFSKDRDVNKWWLDRMPLQGAKSYDDKILGRESELSADGPDPEKEDNVMLSRTRISRIYYKHHFFDYPVKMNWNTIKNMGFFSFLSAGVSYLKSVIWKRPEDNLENFYINRFGRKLYSMFFEKYTEKLWGRHPDVISADWGAQRVKGLSVFAILRDIITKGIFGKRRKQVETSLIEQFLYPKYGPGQLWENAAKEFTDKGGTILYGAKVTRFQTQNDEISEVIFQRDGKEEQIQSDIVISSMPLKDLTAGLPDVPKDIVGIAKGLPYRDFVTVGIEVGSLALQNKTQRKTLNNIVPDCWIYVQDGEVKLGRVQIFNNWSPYMLPEPEKTVWLGLEFFCTEGDRFWNMSPEEWKELGAAELRKLKIITPEEEILDFHCEKVKKAYPAYFDTYNEIDRLIDFLTAHCKNLYCIGRNGQHRYNNMDHSMETAFQAVSNILTGRQQKDNVWNVNTEQEYHEVCSAKEE